MNLTKTVLKRPVTTVMVILCLIVFGLTSVFSSKLELIPSMDMPMLIVMATYPGASPDDVDQLVVQPIEDETGTLTGIKGPVFPMKTMASCFWSMTTEPILTVLMMI